MSLQAREGDEVRIGHGPPCTIDELPAPPAYNRANLMRLVGPGVILLSLSIGSGEWLMGPASAVSYGAAIMWVATIGIVTQVFFNLQCTRYTLYTGEPIMIGFTRLWPGPKLWTPMWVLLAFLCLGPGWAVAAATAGGALILGRMPEAADRPTVQLIGGLLFASVILILMFGGKIQAMLEKVNKVLVAFIFASLILLGFMVASPAVWWEVFSGFFKFGWLPPGEIDWFLLAGLAGFAAAGGIFNMAVSNYFRDKGYAMGERVGYIPSLIGGRVVRVSPVGKVFRITADNVEHFRTWWKYVIADQVWVWGAGCFIGMFLCVLVAYAVVPVGTKVGGWAVAAMQAEGVARLIGPLGWYWVLFIGFWVLWGTQLSVSDTFVRQVTDLVWYASPRVRDRWAREDIRKLYYSILLLFTIWAFYMFNKGVPLFLVVLVANMANVVFFVGGLQLLFMNRLLPKEIRGGLLHQLGVVGLVAFYGIWMTLGLGRGLFKLW